MDWNYSVKCKVFFMFFCLISLHYVDGINKVMMMMMKVNVDHLEVYPMLQYRMREFVFAFVSY